MQSNLSPADARADTAAPVYLTLFPDQYAQQLLYYTGTLPQLAHDIQITAAKHKSELPYLKMAIFGDKRTPKGNCLRHDVNVQWLSGCEADYDASEIGFEEAVRRLQEHGIRALIYTTPSYTAENPRWRILCPFSRVHEGSRNELRKLRTEVLDRLNGIFADGGGFARESWTLSQSYYYGNVDTKPAVRVVVTEGDCIDQRPDLPAVPFKARSTDEVTAVPHEGHMISMEELRAMGQAVSDRAQALHGAGGGEVTEPDADYHYPNLVLLIMGVARIPVEGDPCEVAEAREEVARQIRDAVPDSGMDDAKLASAFEAVPHDDGHIPGPGTFYHYASLGGWKPPRYSVNVLTGAGDQLLKKHPEYFNAANENATGDAWPEPADIFADQLIPEPLLSPDMLPEVISDYAFDEASRLGVDAALVAVPCLGVSAAMLDDAVRLQARQLDNRWTEPARLWLGLVDEPGSNKTGALKAAIDPAKEIERRWHLEDKNKLALYEALVAQFKLRQKTTQSLHGEPPPSEPEKPPRRQIIVNNLTIDGMRDVLINNPRGVLIEAGELTTIIGSFGAYNSASIKERAHFLELYDGGPQSTIRKGEGFVYVPNWGASLIGAIQTERLRKIAHDQGLSDDGFLQRFLLFGGRTHSAGVDRLPNERALTAYKAHLQWIVSVASSGYTVRVSKEAAYYQQQIEELSIALAQQEAFSAGLRQHFNKIRGAYVRLTLMLHAVTCASADIFALEVSGATAETAYRLIVDYFVPMAVRTYGDIYPMAERTENLYSVAGWLLVCDENTITDRGIYQGVRKLRGEQRRAERTDIMRKLGSYGWVRPAKEPLPVSWHVNPMLRKRFADARAAEQKRRAEDQERIHRNAETIARSYRRRA